VLDLTHSFDFEKKLRLNDRGFFYSLLHRKYLRIVISNKFNFKKSMALNIKIDFENCYESEPATPDLRSVRFNTELPSHAIIPMGVVIDEQSQELLPNVYNMAFGPIGDNHDVDDKARITHADPSKVFSTIILSALTFLNNNPDKYVGIDGSNNARAFLYFRIIQNNYDLLNRYFVIYGVNYYVRILRKNTGNDTVHPVDIEDIRTMAVKITKGEVVKPGKMYNYFIGLNR